MVSHEHIFGVGLVKELDWPNLMAGSPSPGRRRFTAEDLAIKSIEDETIELGGNAVVGSISFIRFWGS